MNYLLIIKFIGAMLQFEGLFMLIPFTVGLIYHETQAKYLLLMAAVAFVIGSLLRLIQPKSKKFYSKEGFVVTAFSWIVMSVMGAMPFWISGEINSFTDAVFETASGFTTTGASILVDIEEMCKCMLFWRSFTHWIGGMGVLVFMLIFLKSSADEMNLMRAESPGPSVDKLVPKVRTTAFILYAIYTGITAISIIAFIAAGMPVFDSFCIGFGAAGTGGFGVKADSCASYSPLCQVLITISMFLFGVNFKIYFLIIIKKFKEILKCEEVLWYTIIYIVASTLVAVNIFTEIGAVGESVRASCFQVASIMTTTGFATHDFNLWSSLPKAILVLIMFTGACAGSTGGGIKVSRWILYLKQIKREVAKYTHPRSVKKIRLDGEVVDENTIRSANVYLMAYAAVFIVSMLVICIDGYDLITCFTSVAATLNNIGPGLEVVGPIGNYAGYSILSKWVFVFDMIAGRLELFPVLIMFAPQTWKRK